MWAFYRRFFISLPVKRINADAFLQILNADEAAYLKTVRRRTTVLGGGVALLCNLVLFVPIHLFPQWFPTTSVKTPFFAAPLSLPLREIAWMVPLIFLEIALLTLLNIATVHEVAVATGYITDKNEAEKTDDVLRIALATPAKELSGFGLDPFQGVNRFALLAYNALLLFKGAIMAQLIRQLFVRILGGYAVREILDYTGIPIYMGIDALGSRNVAGQAQLIIMGEAVIQNLKRRLEKRTLTPDEARLLYDTLQFIAINKRDYHRNHYAMTRMLLTHFEIPPEEKHHLPDDYEERLRSAPETIRNLCTVIILLGFVLDGKLSWRERGRIAALHERGVFAETYEEVKRYDEDFTEGRGMLRLWERYFPPLENPLAAFASGVGD